MMSQGPMLPRLVLARTRALADRGISADKELMHDVSSSNQTGPYRLQGFRGLLDRSTSMVSGLHKGGCKEFSGGLRTFKSFDSTLVLSDP